MLLSFSFICSISSSNLTAHGGGTVEGIGTWNPNPIWLGGGLACMAAAATVAYRIEQLVLGKS